MGLLSNIWKMLVLAIRAIAALPLDCLAWLRRVLGLGGPPMPPRYVPETSVEDVLEGFRDAQVLKVGAVDACVDGLGHTVFRYVAAADPEMRSAVDLTGLDDRQTDWLLGLRDEELRRLAQAGPRACELAARGRRCGIVGLPLPADEPSHRPQSGAVVPFPGLRLAA